MPNELSTNEIARSHRWHAVECNNLAWDLSGLAARTPAQDQEMLNAAHASAFHWAKIGTDLNQARANMLLGHVYAVLGRGRTAITYAKQCYDYLILHEPPDWEIAFAHAILAHAAHVAGDATTHHRHYLNAKELGEGITDPEDKAIFFKTFKRIPSP